MNALERSFYTDKQWNQWLGKLASDDFLVVDDFIGDPLYSDIQEYFGKLLERHEFSKAAIGSSEQRQVESSIRGDFIYWLDKQKDTPISQFFHLMDEVIINLKQQLFLSLSDYEFHFALYPPGSRYKKHIDQFRGKNNRVISMLIYLNEDWNPGDGGELKIYHQTGEEILVEPVAKRMLMFRSDSVEHEVLLTETNRKSLTGWLLHQPTVLENLI